MKGIVFNLLESAVTKEHGGDMWDALLVEARSDGVFTSLGNYSDETLHALVRAASDARGEPPDDVIRWFGRAAMPQLAARYASFFVGHTETIPFLLTLNDIIHPEVRKLYPGAGVPDFDFRRPADDIVEMDYRSSRRLCAFAEGLVRGAADHFNETVAVDHLACMKEGDACCTLRCCFSKARR